MALIIPVSPSVSPDSRGALFMGRVRARRWGELNDKWINSQIKAKKPFEKSDGSGLTLVYRQGYLTPVWRLRYRFAGKPRVMVLGSFGDVSLAKARETARTLRARVTLGHDVADEKQERQRDALAKIDAKKNVFTVARLADEFFTRKIMGHVKHPNIVRARIEKDIKPNIGKMPVKDVKPRDIRDMLASVVERGAPTVANDVLRVTLRIFNEAVKDGVIEYNPAAAFDNTDAGGEEEARDRVRYRGMSWSVLRGDAQNARLLSGEFPHLQGAAVAGRAQGRTGHGPGG